MQQLPIAAGNQGFGGAQQAMNLTTLRARCPVNRAIEAPTGEYHGFGELAHAGGGLRPAGIEQAQQQIEAMTLVRARPVNRIPASSASVIE